MEISQMPASGTPPENKQPAASSTSAIPIVGIGASAGGVQALMRLFERMSPNSGMAFVVILHLSPSHQSNVAEVLQNLTSMKVRQVVERTAIERNCIYVVPPNRQLLVNDGVLDIVELTEPARRHASIDMFFRALGDAYRARAIGIVLSGTGADGAVGLARIKEQGGITFAQAPGDAEYDGMPRSAIEANAVDFVLPVAEMPAKLLALWENAKSLVRSPLAEPGDAGAPPAAESSQDMEESLRDILVLLRKNTGHDFLHYKRGTLIRRIERRMQVRAVPTLAAYRDCMQKHPEESAALLQDLLIGVTSFFRDPGAFQALEKDVIPRLFEGRRPGDRIRVWVPACSTGEEAYSLAILLEEQANLRGGATDFQLFATDLDERAIAVARAGAYPLSIEADLTPGRLQQFFTKEDRHYRIRKSLRNKILFAPHSVLKDSPFSRLDLISCRNLMIYLNGEVQARLLELFHFALNPDGYLFLGNVERADAATRLFSAVDRKYQIYQARPLAPSARRVPSLPVAPVSSIRHLIPEPGEPTRQGRPPIAQVHQRALAQFGPPSIVVDQDANVVYISNHAENFLHHVSGEPSRNLPLLVLPQLRLALRSALFQAMQSRQSVTTSRVKLERDGHSTGVSMAVHPYHDKDTDADFVLVVFNETEEAAPAARPAPGDGRSDEMTVQLEEQLEQTRQQLRETIERAEVAGEEYKASNEELQAINEELRAATEELETSKEELQSVNEELVTVNHELKTKVEEASKANDDLNNLIAATDIATVFVDSGMHIKRYTPAAVRIFNLIAGDIGRSLLDITHRLDYPNLADDATETFNSLVPIEREIRSKDDKYYIARVLPYRTADDRIGGAVITFFDITSRRSAEERVKASERRIQLFAESTRDYAIITSDTDGNITSWNQGAQRMFGYTEQEALGRNMNLIAVPEDLEAGVPEQERQRAREHGHAEDERWHLRKDGSRLFCSGMLTSLQNDEFVGYAKILRDVTERKQAESDRAAQMSKEKADRETAETENELKDRFLAVMSHELKQPLNLIHINAEVLARVPELQASPLGQKAVSLIRKTTMSQAQIIDDLLDLSRLTTGKLSLSLSTVDLCAVVNAICAAARTDGASGKLTITVSGTEQPVYIRADPIRIEQIVWNLVNNAIKFTPPGGSIAVEVSQTRDAVLVAVSDTGQGIAPDFLPHVFDIYRQAFPPTTRTTGGLGIGLSLVRQLVDLHGGRVEASSDGPGKGARFAVWLPLHHALPAAGSGAGASGCSTRISGLRILLLDDMEEVVLALQALLEFEGATVVSATTAQDALEKVASENFDLIVSDIAMPNMDGYEFIRRVRAGSRNRDVPAIAVTGMGAPSDQKRTLEAGFFAHVKKPVSVDAIAAKVAELGSFACGSPRELQDARTSG